MISMQVDQIQYLLFAVSLTLMKSLPKLILFPRAHRGTPRMYVYNMYLAMLATHYKILSAKGTTKVAGSNGNHVPRGVT